MVELTTEKMEGQGSYGGFECLWAGTPSAGGGAAVFSQMPQRACLSCGAETKARTLSCGFRVLPILSLIPCLISGAWKAGKKQAWPSQPPSKHNHIAQKNSTQLSSAIPHPMPHLLGTEKSQARKDTSTLCLFPGREQIFHQTEFPSQDSTMRWPCIPIEVSIFLLSSSPRESFW